MRKHNVLGIDILQQNAPPFVHTVLSYMVRQEDNKVWNQGFHLNIGFINIVLIELLDRNCSQELMRGQ